MQSDPSHPMGTGGRCTIGVIPETSELVLGSVRRPRAQCEQGESYLELFDMFFDICHSRMGQIRTVINMCKLFGKLKSSLDHYIQECFDARKLGFTSRPNTHSNGNTSPVHSPSKRVAIWRTLGKRIYQTLCVGLVA